jgi:hypothetical protein
MGRGCILYVLICQQIPPQSVFSSVKVVNLICGVLVIVLGRCIGIQYPKQQAWCYHSGVLIVLSAVSFIALLFNIEAETSCLLFVQSQYILVF